MSTVCELSRNSLNIAGQAGPCPYSWGCPHLQGRPCEEVLAELQRLKAENRDLRGVFNIALDAFKERDSEIASLRAELAAARQKYRELAQRPFARTVQAVEEASCEQQPAQAEQNAEAKFRKKRGAPKGHRGAFRRKPTRPPDKTVFVEPEQCPYCRSRNISRCKDIEEHLQEDIVIARPVLTRFLKRRGYCRDCGKSFFPAAADERPKGRVGPMTLAIAGFLRYGIKIPFEGIRTLFRALWNMELSRSALVGLENKLAEAAEDCYEHLAELVRTSLSINVDETSWPVGPLLQWLWTFTNSELVFFKIAPSRSSAVPRTVLGPHYDGVLTSDCFSAYNSLEARAKQKCLTHYEREAKKLEKFYPSAEELNGFVGRVMDIFKTARQAKCDWLAGLIDESEAEQQAKEFEALLEHLTAKPLENHEAEKLRSRLLAHRTENFTFLRFKAVAPDNNRAERALRSSVVIRKITYGNKSERGARNHERLMSLMETAKLYASGAGSGPLEVMKALAGGKDLHGVKKALFGYSDTS